MHAWANQLSTAKLPDGKHKYFEYDAAGRLIEESGSSSSREYSYGWLDKVLSVRHIDGMKGLDETTNFAYHIDGQLAERKGSDSRESFYWDGLALVKRGETSYINDPAVTGGNPILADDDVLFNDMLGATLGTYGKEFKEINRTTFGSGSEKGFFTGKPYVKELGAVFLFRNYRPELGKWQTSDPLGYPDGWNNFAYVNNWVTNCIDWLGMTERSFTSDDITYTWDWSTASLYQIIGITDSIDPVFNATGDKVTVIWRLNVSWECENCDEGGTITHYQVASVYPCDWSGTNLPAFDIPTFNNIYEGIGNVISTIVGTYYAVTHVVNVGPDGMNNINGSRPSDTAPLTNFKGIDHECAE